MDLAQLLADEGLDGDEVLAWAKARAATLLEGGPGEAGLEGLLDALPEVDASAAPANEMSALQTGEYEIVDAEIAQDEGEDEADGDIAGLDAAAEEGAGEVTRDEDEVAAFEADAAARETAAEAETETGAEPEALEALQSGEYEMVDADELEELDAEDFVEFQSGEYEIVSMDDEEEEEPEAHAGEAAPASRPPAPPPSRTPPPPSGAASGESDDDDDVDIDIDL